MASPGAEQLSRQMRERYGFDRNPWPARALALTLVLGYAAIVGWVVLNVAKDPIETRVLVWSQPLPDRVDVAFEVRRPADLAVTCALRAQDDDRTDLGYAQVDVPAGEATVRQTYPLRVLGPAKYVEVLACVDAAKPERLPQPGFPPSVVPPTQPWTQP